MKHRDRHVTTSWCSYLLFVQHKKTLVWPRLHVLCYCLLPRLHVCRLSLPSWLSTYCLLSFVASSTCLSFIVAIIDVIGLFYICFCQGQVIAAVSSCPSLLVLLIRFRFYRSLPGKLIHSTLLIDRYHFVWSIDLSIDCFDFYIKLYIFAHCHFIVVKLMPLFLLLNPSLFLLLMCVA